MADGSDYCAAFVRTADFDRFIAALFAPAERRAALLALYAFNAEIARVRDVAREALPGEIRLQWWSEVLSGDRRGEAEANPIAASLLRVIEDYRLPAARLIDLIEAHRFDLYSDPMASFADLDAYAASTSSAVFALAAQILGAPAEAASAPAGVAHALTGLLRAFPIHAARGQIFGPADLLERHGVHMHDVFAGRSSAGLKAGLAELRQRAREMLAAAREPLRALPPHALPAMLPLAPVRLMLSRLDRSDPFASAEIPQWRRQWLIWRAARNPARIAG